MDIELLRAVGLQTQRIMAACQKINEGIVELCTELGQVDAKRPPAHDLNLLTGRQKEIFNMIALDIPTAVIAKRLGLSPRTVETHRNTMRITLGFATADELKAFAKQTLQG